MIPRHPRCILVGALAALGLAAAPAVATDGNVYPYDNAAVAAGPQFGASASGSTWTCPPR